MRRYPRRQLLRDRLFGRRRLRSQRRAPASRIAVPLPEGIVMATAYVLEDVWLRPRWPWPYRVHAIELTIDMPIWTGDNAVSGVIYGVRTPARAARMLVNDILLARRHYQCTARKPS